MLTIGVDLSAQDTKTCMASIDWEDGQAQGDVFPRPGLAIDWRRALANRMTDLVIREQTPLTPLSVSADRISHAAMRCAALLSELSAAGLPVDRTGQTGAVVEVYPAASLYRWNLTHRGYKGSDNRSTLSALVDKLVTVAPWLDLAEYEQICRTSDDAFDAVIASLTARAERCGLTEPPTPVQAKGAAREGWIALPSKGSLERLPAS